jgi:signal transduction histidine kinase
LLNRNRIKKKQKLVLQEERLNTQEATINATISSQEKERARYARDLHDGFGQMISILNMNLQNLVGDPKPKDRQKVFEESEKVINEMYDELRSICFDLMPQTLVKNGLSSALEEFATRINAVDQIYVETNFFGIEDRLEEIQEISLYRISQEWINNILKYSDASKITLQITRDEDEMNLIIEDDGMGFDKQLLLKSKGNGWRNIQTRTKLIGGEIELDTTSGKKGNTLILNYDIQKISIRRKQNTLETV